MSPVQLPLTTPTSSAAAAPLPAPDAAWLRTAEQARMLSWLSLAWMAIEGVVGLIAGLDANALSVTIWAASSFVEGLASIIVIWRFTGSRTISATSEHTAQRFVAGSFLLLVPLFVYGAIDRLILGSDIRTSVLGVAVTGSAIVLMPLLGAVKLRLANRLGSHATAGEGVQNLMCAAQAAAALIALLAASAGLSALDPIAALIVAAIASNESVSLWRGSGGDCCAPIGFEDPTRDGSCSTEARSCC
jgi:divalent metal cation (Fe/Co/Zn/Cd) transporter